MSFPVATTNGHETELVLVCPVHPYYRARRRPKAAGCSACRELWDVTHSENGAVYITDIPGIGEQK